MSKPKPKKLDVRGVVVSTSPVYGKVTLMDRCANGHSFRGIVARIKGDYILVEQDTP